MSMQIFEYLTINNMWMSNVSKIKVCILPYTPTGTPSKRAT